MISSDRTGDGKTSGIFSNTLKYVSYKDMKAFAADLKSIYLAPDEKQGYEALQVVADKWDGKYPNAMKSWEQNWDVLTPIFKFSTEVRKVIYTTNAIESLNSTYKKLNRQRTIFPNDKALLKSLYLAVNAPVFWHGIALLKCHRTAHFSVWKTSGASVIGMSHLLHGFV